MKKVVSLIVSAILLISLFGLSTVSAKTKDKTVISVKSVSGVAGDEVLIPVKIGNNPGFSAIAFTFTFDKNALSYKGTVDGLLENYSIFDHSKKGKITVSYTGDYLIKGDYDLMFLKFGVKKKAKEKTSDLKLSKVKMLNEKSKSIKSETSDGNIKISDCCEGEHSYSDWQVSSFANCKKPGVKMHFCKNCGHAENEITQTKEHIIDKTFTVDVAATNSKPGMLSRHCSVCGTKTSIVIYTEDNPTALAINKSLDILSDDSIDNLIYFLNGNVKYPETEYDVTDVTKFIAGNSSSIDETSKPAINDDKSINVDVAVDKILGRLFGDDERFGTIVAIKRAALAGEIPIGILNWIICLIAF